MTMPSRILVTCAFVLSTLFLLPTAHAGLVSLPFSENFQSTAPSANAAADYPAFTLSGSGSANVSASGVLNLVNAAADITPSFTVTPNVAPTKEVIITADISAVNSGGSFNVGLIVGQNNVVFHPGLGGGAFRVEGNGGYGNQNMNFDPQNNVLYRFEVHSFPDGLFTTSVTDTVNNITYMRPISQTLTRMVARSVFFVRAIRARACTTICRSWKCRNHPPCC